MVFRPVVLSAAALLISLTFGCGSASQAPMLGHPSSSLQRVSSTDEFKEGPATKEAFIAAVKAKGVKLTEANLVEIQAERQVTPNGLHAPRPAENLSAAENLEVHFRKHGHEFRPALKTAEEYLAQGNAAGTGSRGEVRYFFDTTSYKKGYQTHVIRWVPKTRDFTAFRTDGAQTTYYQSVPKPNRFIEVPIW